MTTLDRSLRNVPEKSLVWELIDRSATLERLANDESLFRELVDFFLADHGPLVTALETAVVQRDAPALERAAHSLKGLAANLGAVAVADVAAELEGAGRQKTWPPVETALPRLQRELPRLVGALNRYRAEQV